MLFPLPGGEGQGEGERHTNFFPARNQGKGMNGKGIKTKSGEFCFPIPLPFIPLPCIPFHPARNSVRGMIVRGIKSQPEEFCSPIPLTLIPLTNLPNNIEHPIPNLQRPFRQRALIQNAGIVIPHHQ
jgi:hypothetical protein